MCGEAAPVDQISRDSKTLEMDPSQMDTLVDCNFNFTRFSKKLMTILVTYLVSKTLFFGTLLAPEPSFIVRHF